MSRLVAQFTHFASITCLKTACTKCCHSNFKLLIFE